MSSHFQILIPISAGIVSDLDKVIILLLEMLV